MKMTHFQGLRILSEEAWYRRTMGMIHTPQTSPVMGSFNRMPGEGALFEAPAELEEDITVEIPRAAATFEDAAAIAGVRVEIAAGGTADLPEARHRVRDPVKTAQRGIINHL